MKHPAFPAAFFLAFAVSAGLSGAEKVPFGLIQPLKSGLTFARADANVNGPYYAEFGGKTWVKGVLAARWILGVDEKEANTLHVVLIPDRTYAARLPYFAGYPVTEITPENIPAALRLVFGEEGAGKIERKETKAAKAEGFFRITGYAVGVECDSPWARARILEVRIPESPRFAGQPVDHGC